MNKLLVGVALVALAAVLVLTGVREPSAVAQEKAAVRWEYSIISGDPSITEFNKLGNDGWELVGTVHLGTNRPTYSTFKRVKR